MEKRKMSKPQTLDAIQPMQEQPQPKKDEKPKDPVQAEFEEGKAFLESNNTTQAAIAFHNVLLAHEEKNDENGIANASNQLGHVCLAREDFEQAEKHYKRAWDICEKADDPMSQIALNIKFIEVYRGLKDYKKAINICLDLMDDYRLNNNAQGGVAMLEKLAELFVESGNKEGAVDAYKTAASIHRNYQHEGIAKSLEEKADALV